VHDRIVDGLSVAQAFCHESRPEINLDIKRCGGESAQSPLFFKQVKVLCSASFSKFDSKDKVEAG